MKELKVIDRLQKVCDENDWAVDVYQQGNEYYFELETSTDRDQDVLQTFFVKDYQDEEQIKQGLYTMWMDFDPDEEASKWIGEDGHGKNGAPYRLSELLADMQDVEHMLETLFDDYCKAV